MTAEQLLARIEAIADDKNREFFSRLSHTRYKLYGARVPDVRKTAKQFFRELTPAEVLPLLTDPVHECRLLALLLWVQQFTRGDEACREAIVALYLAHTDCINNWDLVDLSAYEIVGAYLLPRDRSLLDRLAGSPSLWEQRIAIVSTWAFIRRGEFDDTYRRPWAGCSVRWGNAIKNGWNLSWRAVAVACPAPCCVMPWSVSLPRSGPVICGAVEAPCRCGGSSFVLWAGNCRAGNRPFPVSRLVLACAARPVCRGKRYFIIVFLLSPSGLLPAWR